MLFQNTYELTIQADYFIGKFIKEKIVVFLVDFAMDVHIS